MEANCKNMNLDGYHRDVQNHSNEIAKLQQEKSREATKAADESKRANAASEAASRSSSLSTKQSKYREAQRHQDSAINHQKKVADIEMKIAREQSRLTDAQKKLADAQKKMANAQADAQKKLFREQEEFNREQMRQQEQSAREHERRMKVIAGKLTEHDELHEVAMTAIEKLQALPERISVLFLAANPLDQVQLRLDEEARAIDDMIRRAKHRDAIKFESRWAVRPLDLLQSINELEPRIIHFSGHGSDQDQIVFQDDAGRAKLVTKEAIVQTMAAASDKIQLVFFNTCYSRGQAEAVVKHVPAAIGMNTEIGDGAARVFAAQFYSSIGFGLSVGRAFKQAVAALMLEGIPENTTPELFVTANLDVNELILVKPADKAS